MNHGPKGHRVGDLTVEPYVLIGGEKPGELWSDYTNDVSQHRDEDEATIIGQDEASASRRPYRVLEGIEARKYGVDFLWKATTSCRLSLSCLATTGNGDSLANTIHRRRGRGGYRKRRR